MVEEFKKPKPNLTNDDFTLADEIFDTLMNNPRKALKLYMRAKPEVKKMLGNFDPRELLVQVNPNINSQKIMDYINAHENGDELRMRRIYESCNQETQQEIDDLIG